MIYIYALIDPFTKSIRYIGKSIRPSGRLTNHCNEKSVTYRTNWIRQVIAQGGRPEIAILEELPDDANWQEAEKRWITYGREVGWSLTNCTDGGDGVPNLPPEIRKRISSAWIGRKHKPESLIKIGQASKGRVQTEEHRQKMREKMLGRKFTPEWLHKIAKSLNKLTDDQVREIRKALSEGANQYVLAEQYGVHQGTISNINCRKNYKHIE